MKKLIKPRAKKHFNIGLLIWLIISLVFIISIIIIAAVLHVKESLTKVLYDLFTDVFSALIITGGLVLFIDLIKKNYFKDVVDIKKLRGVGIDKVGDGVFKRKDELKMFGTYTHYKNYPYCLKFMFLTGNEFLGRYKQEIINCINEGCRVQILLANPNGDQCLTNLEKLFSVGGKQENLSAQFDDETSRYLKYIADHKNKYCSGSLAVRFYENEYLNSFRAAKYTMRDCDVTHYWINVQSLTECAKDFSVGLKGTVESNSDGEQDKNFFESYERGFDYLWDKYIKTEQTF